MSDKTKLCNKYWRSIANRMKFDGKNGHILSSSIRGLTGKYNSIIRPGYTLGLIIGTSVIAHHHMYQQALLFFLAVAASIFMIERRYAKMFNCLMPARMSPNQEFQLATTIKNDEEKLRMLQSVINEDRQLTALELSLLIDTPPASVNQKIVDLSRYYLYSVLKLNQVSGKNTIFDVSDSMVMRRVHNFDYIIINPDNLLGLVSIYKISRKRVSAFIHFEANPSYDNLDMELLKDPVIREFVLQAMNIKAADIPADPESFISMVRKKTIESMNEGLCEFVMSSNTTNLEVDRRRNNRLIAIKDDVLSKKNSLSSWVSPNHTIKLIHNFIFRDEISYKMMVLAGSSGQYDDQGENVTNLWSDRDGEKTLGELKQVFIHNLVSIGDRISLAANNVD